MRNIVDFHIHGVGSVYKDAFATASYDHICAYFQRLAESKKRNAVIAFTEHDCSIMTYKKYKELQNKYPNVKIILGMEANVKLTHATDKVFEVAHVLAYADMSSEESIKKWLDCEELKDLSKIRTFQVPTQDPSNEYIITNFCDNLNSQYGTKIDIKDVVDKFANSKLGSRDLQTRVIYYLAEKIFENKDFAFANCKNVEEVLTKLKSLEFLVDKKPGFYGGLMPSQYGFSKEINVMLAVKKLEKNIGKSINIEELNGKLNYGLASDKFDEQFATLAAEIMLQDKAFIKKINIDNVMLSQGKKHPTNKDIEQFIRSRILKNAKFNCVKKTTSQFFVSGVFMENFGERLYMAKSILNKNIGTKITNRELAELLSNTKSRDVLRNQFISLVKFSLKYNQPELYKRIEKLPIDVLSKTTLGRNRHGVISLDRLITPYPNSNRDATTDIRTSLEEINNIVKKTGGHLILAHPDLVFKYTDGKTVPAYAFRDTDKELVSKSKYKKIKEDLYNYGCVDTSKLQGSKQKLLKLELFFRLCKKNGIKFDGFEIRKSNIADRENLRNYLIYAAKNNYDISFGSDTHLSNMHFYNDLLIDGKITQGVFDKLAKHADKIGDDTASTNAYQIYYPSKFKTESQNIDFANIKDMKPCIKTDKYGKLYNTNKYTVVQTNFCDKMIGKSYKGHTPLMTLIYDNKLYFFGKESLKYMKYNFDKKAATSEECIEK